MADQTATSQVIDIAKMIAPWITGGLAGAILTLIARTREDRKRRKVITIETSLTAFALPKVQGTSAVRQEDLNVSYKGKSYAHLSLYRFAMRNTGPSAVQNQTVVLAMPTGLDPVDEMTATEPLQIEFKTDMKTTPTGDELSISVPRLEPGDAVTYSLLVNGSMAEQIRCHPRGTDDVKFRFAGQPESGQELEAEVKKLLLLFAMFFVVGAFDPIGGVFQAGVFLFMIPYLRHVLLFVLRNVRTDTSRITIGQVRTEGEGTVNVLIK